MVGEIQLLDKENVLPDGHHQAGKIVLITSQSAWCLALKRNPDKKSP